MILHKNYTNYINKKGVYMNYWLWLASIDGIGSKKKQKLLDGKYIF